MIRLRKINDAEIIVNCDLIEVMQENPDTTITLTTGRKIIVKESVDEIIDNINTYRKSLKIN